ncbi:RNA polymerase sigma factor [Kitasatospora aburaviensis]
MQQTFLLTACKHRALHCVGRAFAEAQRHWVEVSGETDPEAWLRTRAFEAALSPWHRGGPRRTHVWRLPHRRIKVRPADETQAVLPDHDRLTDHDRALLKALKRLSRPQRRALLLHDGLGLPADAVAVEVESTVTAAEGRVWAARTALAHWVPDLVGADPAADGFADRLSGLLLRAAVRGCPEPHRPPLPLLRARHGLADAGRTGAAALLTAAVGAAVVATLSGGGPGQLFRPGEPPAPSLCATAATTAAVPAPPDAPPTGVHSLWCSSTPGVEPVVVDPPPPRRLWELPSAGRPAEALPPPGTVAAGPPACTGWTLHPCPTDDH